MKQVAPYLAYAIAFVIAFLLVNFLTSCYREPPSAESAVPATQIEPDAAIFEELDYTTTDRIKTAYEAAYLIRRQGYQCSSFSYARSFPKFLYISCNHSEYAYALIKEGDAFEVKFLPKYLLADFYEKIQQTSDSEAGMEMLGDSLYLDIIELP